MSVVIYALVYALIHAVIYAYAHGDVLETRTEMEAKLCINIVELFKHVRKGVNCPRTTVIFSNVLTMYVVTSQL